MLTLAFLTTPQFFVEQHHSHLLPNPPHYTPLLTCSVPAGMLPDRLKCVAHRKGREDDKNDRASNDERCAPPGYDSAVVVRAVRPAVALKAVAGTQSTDAVEVAIVQIHAVAVVWFRLGQTNAATLQRCHGNVLTTR